MDDNNKIELINEKTGSYFDSSVLELLLVNLKFFFVVFLTCGILYPLGVCIKQEYLVEKSVIQGKRLKFTGTWTSLFKKYMIWWLLSLITCGIYVFWLKIKMQQWVSKNTVFVDATDESPESYFDGMIKESIILSLTSKLLLLITCGIALPYTIVRKCRWEENHKCINGRRIRFVVDAKPFFLNYLVWILLTMITCGIYRLWLALNVNKWIASNRVFEDNDENISIGDYTDNNSSNKITSNDKNDSLYLAKVEQEKNSYEEYKKDIAMKAQDFYKKISFKDYDDEEKNNIETSYADFTLLLENTKFSPSSKEKIEEYFNELKTIINNALPTQKKELLKKEFNEKLIRSKEELNKFINDCITRYPNLKNKFDKLRNKYLIDIDNVCFKPTFKTNLDDLNNNAMQKIEDTIIQSKRLKKIKRISIIGASVIVAILCIVTSICIGCEMNTSRYIYKKYPISSKSYAYEFVGIGNNFGYSKKNDKIIEVNIPKTYKDIEVVHISSDAFKTTPNVQKISIPDTVTAIGDNTFEGCSSLASIIIPNTVTAIGDNAFKGCSSLSSITIPNNVTIIGDNAFEGCSSLSSITISNSVTTFGNSVFNDCNSLEINYIILYGRKSIENLVPSELKSKIRSVSIPDSVTSIGWNAFAGCSSLTSITIPSSVTYIDKSAFEGCSSLSSIIVDANNTKFDSRENCNAIIESDLNELILGCKNTIIPDSVTSIEAYAFDGCSSLASITIPDSVTSIKAYAFDGCSSLASITIPDSVTSIEAYAFNGCSSLASITIPDSVTSIEAYAFNGCSSLTSIIIPSSVTYIGVAAFENCSSLASITIPDSVTYIDNYVFNGCSSLTSIIIPSSVTYIGAAAFEDCSSLASITIPDNITFIGDHAFDGCASLTSIIISSSVTSIGGYAFYDCASLTSIIIPSSVTSVGRYAFWNCLSLTIYCIATEKPSGWNYYWSGDCTVVWGYQG